MLKKYLLIFLGLAVVGSAIVFVANNLLSDYDDRMQTLKVQKNINGIELSSELFQSEYLIVNFWASWCAPCVEETPALIKFSIDNPEYKLIAISQDDSLDDIQNFIKVFPNYTNAHIDIVFDHNKDLARRYSVVKLPETFIYSRSKKKYIQLSGATNWADPQLKEMFQKELEKSNSLKL